MPSTSASSRPSGLGRMSCRRPCSRWAAYMADEALLNYARDLAAEVEEAIQGGDGAVYTEEEFTRLVLDKLGDDGALDNPMLLYQEGTFGRSKYKITGYSIPEAEDRLLLVTTVHTGELPPRDLTHEEVQTAVTR